MQLVKPCEKYKDEYHSYIEEVLENKEEHKLGEVLQRPNETFEEMIIRVEQISRGENLIGQMKPTTVFWIVENNIIVGSMNLRHELSEFTYYTIGNLGYYIRPSQRKKGYATKALGLTKEFYRQLGVKKILLICSKDNIASEKVIIANKGGNIGAYTQVLKMISSVNNIMNEYKDYCEK